MHVAPQLIVGTAGHIDHGKSRLVLALTGTDPDRLPEEKARGMTIDLGFAYLRADGCDIWLVDVPGHERFIRNMVAGATGIDAALLVVAADDSVMPQTREHAEVLSLLGVRRCVVVLTKMDLVDEQWADQVAQEACDLLASVGLDVVAAVRTSAETGRGLDDLRGVLATLARGAAPGTEEADWFMLPVDRAFSVPGRGTVVTGSVRHGQVSPGDELELFPGAQRVRVRGLQSHSQERERAAGRMRLAVNLAGVSHDAVQRGYVLATPGYLVPARRFDVWLSSLRMPGKQRRRNLRIRLHVATAELLALVRLMEAPAELDVRDTFAQLVTSEAIVAVGGQRFVVRDEAGTRTLGGGRILRVGTRPWTVRRPARLEGLRALLSSDPVARVEETLSGMEWRETDARRLAALAGVGRAEEAAAMCRLLVERGRVHRFECGSGELFVHAALAERVGEFLEKRMSRHFEQNARSPGVPLGEWPGWMPRACPARARAALADWLIQGGRFSQSAGHILPRGRKMDVSAADEALYAAMIAEFESAACQPPALDELRCRTPGNARRVAELVRLAMARGDLRRIAEGIWLHRKCWEDLVRLVSQALQTRGALRVSDLRDLLKTTRKYMVPIAEHLDTAGITRRIGDTRKAGPNVQV